MGAETLAGTRRGDEGEGVGAADGARVTAREKGKMEGFF